MRQVARGRYSLAQATEAEEQRSSFAQQEGIHRGELLGEESTRLPSSDELLAGMKK
jgi:hypothetical protein